jgi:hypothetical protein
MTKHILLDALLQENWASELTVVVAYGSTVDNRACSTGIL